jgi:CMP-N,N'-diacetyllegionaminic acid synthase
MILGHIGARKGSKGVPGKNFPPDLRQAADRLVAGPAFASPTIDAVVVSTDDPAILAHAIARGALTSACAPRIWPPIRRENGACGNTRWRRPRQITGPATAFLDLDCTSPLRLPEDIDECADLFAEARPDMVMSCCEARKNPYFNLVEPDATGALHVSKPLPGGVVARQQAPVVYEHAASTYVVAPDYLGAPTACGKAG